jgi:hypothetical protein
MTAMVGYPKDPVKTFPTSAFNGYAKYGGTGASSAITIEEACNHTAPYAQLLAHIDDGGDPAVGMAYGPTEFIPDLRLNDGVMARWGEALNVAPPSRGIVYANYAMPVPGNAVIKRVEMAVWIKRNAPYSGTGFLVWSSDGNFTTAIPGTEFDANDPAQDWVRYVYTLPQQPQAERAWVPSDFHACYAGVLMYGGGFIGPQLIVEYEEEDGMTERINGPVLLWNAVTAGQGPTTIPLGAATKVVFQHTMSDTITGGYLSFAGVTAFEAANVTVTAGHHGGGTNIPTGNRTVTYECTLVDCIGDLAVTLNRTDGTHTVTYETFR